MQLILAIGCVQQLMLSQKNPRKRYIRVVGDKKGFVPEPLEKFGNLSHISKGDFLKSFNLALKKKKNYPFLVYFPV